MLKRTREIWDNAPVNPALDGKAIRIPGYVVPLDQAGAGLKKSLLVPTSVPASTRRRRRRRTRSSA
jgi:hypothetical protein